MSVFRKLALVVLLIAGAAKVSTAADFIVVSAPRHPAVTNPQGAFRSDDPQLVGRIVSFNGSAASFDGSYKACSRTTKTTAQISIGQLIRRIYPDRPNYSKRGRQAADYAACATRSAVCADQFQGMSSSHRAAGQSAAIFPVTSAM